MNPAKLVEDSDPAAPLSYAGRGEYINVSPSQLADHRERVFEVIFEYICIELARDV